MDKRSLIFIVLVSLSFITINYFFSSAPTPSYITQSVASEECTTTTDIPLVTITSDPEGKNILTQAIKVDDHIFTLAWDHSLPSLVYVQGEARFLVTKEASLHTPVLYTHHKGSSWAPASIPSSGTYPVLVLTFQDNRVISYQANYIQGRLEYTNEIPSANGVVMYKGANGWFPLAFYNNELGIATELDDLTPSETLTDEQFYVLENDYQQLVFSNVGGAITAINLPFTSSDNSYSVVKEIGFDRQLSQHNPTVDRFPNVPYLKYNTTQPQVSSSSGGFYPLLRTPYSPEPSPEYYAFNIISEYPELAHLHYRVIKFTKNEIVFEGKTPQRTIRKTYRLQETKATAPYCFDVEIQIEGESKGLWITSGIPEVELLSNRSSPLVQYRILRNQGDDIEKVRLPKVKEATRMGSAPFDWIVNSNGYFGIVMDPTADMGNGFKVTSIPGETLPTRLSLIKPEHHLYPASQYPGYQVALPFPQKGGSFSFRVFAGPFEEGILKQVDKLYQNKETGYSTHYLACKTFHGWFSFIGKPFAKLLFIVMKSFHHITQSWALSIVCLTIFLRILLYPLNAWFIKSMRRMQKLAPEIQALQQKHKKDPKKAQLETMRLYQEKKANPLTGCLPMVIQLPFLIAMFDLLKSSFQLRGAPFIPGWINDLTAPDVLFSWNVPIFFLGTSFHLLPIILGVTMFMQQRLMTQGPKNPSEMTDQQRQQRAMSSIMTLVFTFMFYHFPSGLNIYWLSSTLLGMLQQWMTNKWLNYQETEKLPSPKKC